VKLVVLAVGRMKAGPERDLLRRYVERAEALARNVGLTGLQMVELDESRLGSASERRRAEAAALGDRVPAGATLMLLDERGRGLSSQLFAAAIGRERDGGAPALGLVIGGPDGLDPAWLAKHDTLAFGPATFPHQLVRVMLAEQVYRAFTILAGHPYHRS
jgi:23S rRNA (pseudouridine1915-N3)-methyltransferase